MKLTLKMLAVLLSAVLLFGCTSAVFAEEVQELNYELIYRDVLNGFYDLVCNGAEWSDAMDGGVGVLELTMGLTKEEALNVIGYDIRDLSGDGIPELVIGYVGQNDTEECTGREILAIFTCKDGVPCFTAEGWIRNCIQLMTNGCFLRTGSNGAAYSIFGTYALSEDGAEMQCNDFFFTYEKNGNFDDIGVFYNLTGEWDVSKSYELNITMEEYEQTHQALANQVVEFPMTPLSQLVPGSTGPVKAEWADKVGVPDGIEPFRADDGEMPATVAFLPKEPVHNFLIMRLLCTDIDEAGIPNYEIQDTYSWDTLEADTPLVVEMSFYGTIPNYGISYLTEDGTAYRYAVSISGRDGSILLLDM